MEEYRRLLLIERRKSAALAQELAITKHHMAQASCLAHTAAEVDGEAAVNHLIKSMHSLRKNMEEHNCRTVMELEREEERIVNGLMIRLEEVTREKRMLEMQIDTFGMGGGGFNRSGDRVLSGGNRMMGRMGGEHFDGNNGGVALGSIIAEGGTMRGLGEGMMSGGGGMNTNDAQILHHRLERISAADNENEDDENDIAEGGKHLQSQLNEQQQQMEWDVEVQERQQQQQQQQQQEHAESDDGVPKLMQNVEEDEDAQSEEEEDEEDDNDAGNDILGGRCHNDSDLEKDLEDLLNRKS